MSSAALQALQQDDEWVEPTPGANSHSAPYTADSQAPRASCRFIDDEARDGEGNAADDEAKYYYFYTALLLYY